MNKPSFFNILFISIIACLIFAYFSYKSEQELLPKFGLIKPKSNSSAPQNNVSKSIPNEQVREGIVYALKQTAQDLRRGIDVNEDGLVNCIDAAVRFYYHFPYKEYVCIVVNFNLATGMNHLFNGVLIDGSWRMVEPQAYYKNYTLYYMRDIWGKQYNSSKNVDATDKYLKFVK